jgi:hypothetical protein
MGSQQNEQVQFVMRSRWVRNRSKFMVFYTIREGSVEHTNLCANLLFILFNAPVPTATLRCSLAKWVAWKYLIEMPNGGYALTSKGRSFLRFMEGHYQFITDDWYQDLAIWRSIPKDTLKDAGGNWLPQPKFIKAIEAMKWHRMGTKRLGTHAGRPAVYNHCSKCHASYGLDIPECPLCRMNAERAARVPQATLSPRPVVIKSEATVCRCPKCDGLCQFIAGSWVCPSCQVTVWSTGM